MLMKVDGHADVGGRVRVVLVTGHEAPSEFHEAIRLQVMEVVPAMQAGVSYTVRMLCDPEYWAELDRSERQLAGRCVAAMGCAGVLPLEFAGRNSANARLYRLK